jgi:hypothetical protein
MKNRDHAPFLPTSVQKSYFMLSRPTRAVLDTALQKYRRGRSDPIFVGGISLLKPALRLMIFLMESIKTVSVAWTPTIGCVSSKR